MLNELTREFAAAQHCVALFERHWRARFDVSGTDTLDFLQRILTCGVTNINPGEIKRGLLLTPKGKTVIDMDLWIDGGVVSGVCDAAARGLLFDSLERYVLRSDVRLRDRSGTDAVIGVVGPLATNLMKLVGMTSAVEHGWNMVQLAGVEATMACHQRRGHCDLELILGAKDVGPMKAALLQAGQELGAVVAGEHVAEVLRIEAGEPRFGMEITGHEFPQELHLVDAIDFDKGCYVGQEPVARIQYRGHVNRTLTRIRGEDGLEADGAILLGERQVGKVTSVAASPDGGQVGLALLQRKVVEDGRVVRVGNASGRSSVISPVETETAGGAG